MQIPRSQHKNDAADCNDSDSPDHASGLVSLRLSALCMFLPYTCHWQGGRQSFNIALQHENAIYNPQNHVDEHGELAHPAQNPIPLKVLNQSEESGKVGSGGKKSQHPNDEEVVGYHGLDFCQTNDLNTDPLDELLVGET